MNTPACGTTKKLLGEILIEGNFVAPEDVECALERQKLTNEQLGEILLGMGVMDSMDLMEVLSAQGDDTSLDFPAKTTSAARELLEALRHKTSRITREQLDSALEEQRRTGEKLGAVLIRHGLLDEGELNEVLSLQRFQADKVQSAGHLRLGEILIATEQITRNQLEDVLVHQKISKKKIGELLVEAGYAKPHQIDHGLKLQKKLLTAALVTAISMANVVGIHEAYGQSDTTSAKITVSARVLERTGLELLNQVRDLVITDADITRGFVEVPAATRIQVKSNNPDGCLLAFEVMNEPGAVFDAVNVSLGNREVQLSPGGGWIPQPYTEGGVTLDLSYRFTLAKNVQPGTYSWPLQVSVQPM